MGREREREREEAGGREGEVSGAKRSLIKIPERRLLLVTQQLPEKEGGRERGREGRKEGVSIGRTFRIDRESGHSFATQ